MRGRLGTGGIHPARRYPLASNEALFHPGDGETEHIGNPAPETADEVAPAIDWHAKRGFPQSSSIMSSAVTPVSGSVAIGARGAYG